MYIYFHAHALDTEVMKNYEVGYFGNNKYTLMGAAEGAPPINQFVACLTNQNTVLFEVTTVARAELYRDSFTWTQQRMCSNPSAWDTGRILVFSLRLS